MLVAEAVELGAQAGQFFLGCASPFFGGLVGGPNLFVAQDRLARRGMKRRDPSLLDPPVVWLRTAPSVPVGMGW